MNTIPVGVSLQGCVVTCRYLAEIQKSLADAFSTDSLDSAHSF